VHFLDYLKGSAKINFFSLVLLWLLQRGRLARDPKLLSLCDGII